MFRKLLIVGVALAAASSVMAGGNYRYKGERPVVYKGQLPPPQPCLPNGPYFGLSVGNKVNYTGAPVVYNGIEGILSGGWAALFTPDFYLAGELWIADSAKIKDYQDGLTSVRTTWIFGGSLIPGVMLTDTILGYIRLGVHRGHFRGNPPGDGCNCNTGTTRDGWHVGLGGQTNLAGGFNLRGEYVYGQFSSISFLGTPRTHNFNLGLTYQFIL